MITTINEYKSILNQIRFERRDVSTLDDLMIINAYYNNERIGQIIGKEEFTEIFYDEWDINEGFFETNKIGEIQNLKVEPKYMSMGIGRKLMNLLLEWFKELNITEFYLNASPMGFHGLDLNELIEFYETFGFNVVTNDPDNSLMVKYDNKI